MMDDVENGKIGVCIMKDLTRWGRDYLQVGNAMEIFRRNNVRFIAVNNGIDSEKPDTLEFAPFINIMSEWYAKDISKKVKTGIKTKGMSGKPIVTEAPYGYIKAPDNKNFWIIDEEAAEVVRLIFRLFLDGKNRNQIAVYLTQEQIPSPTFYMKDRGRGTCKNKTLNEDNRCKWNKATLTNILTRQEYCGDVVNFKTTKHFRDKHNHYVDRSQWHITGDERPELSEVYAPDPEGLQRLQPLYEPSYQAATGLSVKRNKKKAEALLQERRRNFKVSTAPAEIRLDDDILFSDFMLKWLEVTKSTIQITTYASYQGMVERVIVPYFRKRGIKLVDLKATDLQDFYNKQLERVKANSVIHYHANIHKALKYAVKIDLIPSNPADKVERPKKNEFKGSYYSADEIHALTEIAEGTKLEIPVLLASFYGLRRSEVLGLKWDAIDFEANTLEVKHIVTQASIDGKKVLVQADRAKTKSSLRTLPLVPHIRDRLLMLKGQQDTYRRLCGKSYNRDYLGYLCVDEIGNIIRPNYVSEQFPKLLEKNGLRPIRFHDLRHSCASLLLANGVPMKQIQEWLGHSDFSTTANIYAHLDYASKLSSAQAMMEGLGYGNASA